ncbi:hypothetical protein [Lysobacter sp. CA199]|uniref:hypothetical protein n=1 Tax=Lysobacter sp. CA199 TaxID=3455608 RepID=UPI003F8D4DEE
MISTLIGQGSQRAAVTEVDEKAAGAPTTIRLSPEARTFFAAHAEAFGQMSMSSFIAMTLEGVMRETQASDRDQPHLQMKRQIELTRDRILHVFRVHGYEPQEIAEFLNDFGVSVSTLHDEKAFLDLLTDPLIDRVRRHFHVPAGWLGDGPAYGYPPPVRNWYKGTEGAIARLVALAKAGRRPKVLIVRNRRAKFANAFEQGDKAATEPVGIVIAKEHRLHHRTHTLYETWEFQRWNYDKCRHYLKALIEWIERQRNSPSYHDRIYIQGISLEPALLEKLERGQLLPTEVLAMDRQDGSTIWYPEDLMDPERSDEAAEISFVREHYCKEDVFQKYLDALINPDHEPAHRHDERDL